MRQDPEGEGIFDFDEVTATLSGDRIATYLNATGRDLDRALTLYLWNSRIGEAFHLPIQAVEVAFRNRLNAVLLMRFGSLWWQEGPLF